MERGNDKRMDGKTTGHGNVATMRSIAIEKVVQLLQQIRFGEVVITIHDSKIVQIEKREKTRFQD